MKCYTGRMLLKFNNNKWESWIHPGKSAFLSKFLNNPKNFVNIFSGVKIYSYIKILKYIFSLFSA